MEVIAFYFFAALTIVMFTITVMAKQTVYAFSSLAAGMIFISAFFFLVNAEFMGIVQIVVYTGAVMALYAFGMMFFDSSKPVVEKIKGERTIFILSTLVAVVVVLMISGFVVNTQLDIYAPIDSEQGNTMAMGMLLFSKYLIPFELTGLLLLTAMISGIVLASKKMEYGTEERGQ